MLLTDKMGFAGGKRDSDSEVVRLRKALVVSQLKTAVGQEKVRRLIAINDCLCEELLEQETKLADAQIIAHYDQLTGLPNRTLLLDRFQLAMANAVRHHRLLALLFLDLNDFKKINDQHGHAVGDKLLQRVAKRLACSVRAIDTACRYGGDEFVLLLSEVDSLQAATGVAKKIGKTLSLPYHIETQELHLKVSIGIAMYPMDGNNFADLISKADLAMYVVKGNGAAEPIEVVALDPGYRLPKRTSSRTKNGMPVRQSNSATLSTAGNRYSASLQR